MSEKRTNKGWKNLQPQKYSFANKPKEELRELAKKGAQRMHEVKQERRTAKQCLADILSLEATPDIIAGADLDPLIAEQLQKYADKITMYDLINLVAVGAAAGGNVRAMEFCRDSVGDMPVKSIDISGMEIMTEADREMLRHIEERLKNNEMIYVVDEQTGQGKFENVKPDTAAGEEAAANDPNEKGRA